MNYYVRIIRILLMYLSAGCICEIFDFIAHNKVFSVKNLIVDLLSFKTAPYAWYIEMYIGLFLLIPFLNILWKNLGEHEKRILVISLCILTCFPSILCSFDFGNSNWWQATKDSFTQIGTIYWETIFPITYYFIGAYICDYKEKVISRIRGIVIPFFMLVFGTLNYIKNYLNVFPWTYDVGYSSFQCIIVGVCYFCIKKTVWVKPLWKLLSKYSLGMYLCSYVADCVVYHFINGRINDYSMRLLISPISIMCVAVISLIMAITCTLVTDWMYRKWFKC